MDIVGSKNICILMREVLRLIDRRLVDHGSRVGYVLARMLQCKGGYEDFELAEYAFLGIIHDIGAYKVEKEGDMLRFETKDVMPHSIYGAMFLKYLTPMEDRSKIIMYSHIDYRQLEEIDYEEKNIANYLNLAGRMDLYRNALGEKFDHRVFRKYEGVKYSKEALDLYDEALVKYDIFDKLKTGAYKQELDEMLSKAMFGNEEKEKYIKMAMFVSGFRNEYNSINTVMTCCIAKEIAIRMNISEEDQEKLYFASLLHDLGMLTIPREIIEAPRALTPEEVKLMREHVSVTEKILKDRVSQDVLEIAIRHHERSDGSGYPRGLVNQDMTQLQRILQVADTVTGLTAKRSYRKEKSKESVIAILTDEVNHNRFHKGIVDVVIHNYDEIQEVVQKNSAEIFATYNKLHTQYDQISSSLRKPT